MVNNIPSLFINVWIVPIIYSGDVHVDPKISFRITEPSDLML